MMPRSASRAPPTSNFAIRRLGPAAEAAPAAGTAMLASAVTASAVVRTAAVRTTAVLRASDVIPFPDCRDGGQARRSRELLVRGLNEQAVNPQPIRRCG